MRPKGPKDELEIRRRTAIALLKQGLSHRQIAAALHCAKASVTRWKQMVEKDGEKGLKSRPQAGPVSRLKPKEKEQLLEMIRRGARQYGYRNELWTLSRIKRVIEEKFGIGYHISHVHRLLHQLGLSAQKPMRRAREQDTEAVQTFRETTWAEIKKSRT